MASRSSKHDTTTKTAPIMRVKKTAGPAAVFDADGVAVTLIPGQGYPPDHWIVKAHGWAFEEDWDAPPLPVAVVSPVADTTYAPVATARLEAARAELADLERKPKAALPGTNIDDLAASLQARAARAEALRLTIPTLERDVMLERRNQIEATLSVEGVAFDQAFDAFEEARERFARARADFEAAQFAWNAAQHRQNAVAQRLSDENLKLAGHEGRHFGGDGTLDSSAAGLNVGWSA